MKKLFALFFVVSFLLVGIAAAEDVPTPTKLEGVKIASTAEVKALLGQKGVYIFDMRKALNYGKGHLQGAKSLPLKWLSEGADPSVRKGEFDMAVLPPDKNAKIIFYSDGPNGWKSYNAAKMTKEAGYKNVIWMREGSAAWEGKGYPME
ncbi:MAG: rhodanese-like domain-containing protein [Nitrospiraceae bacterium]|nr:MAG: rhodanese-like domain-containing protein [Nitrospiraceae bacterium]